jgi:ElaB/YqjD/DUF883 family membrane-anchored ribosome-binding protein
MDTMTNNNVPKSGPSLIDKTADKMHGGISDIQRSAKDTHATISNRLEGLGNDVRQMVDSATDQAKPRIDTVKHSVRQTRNSVSESSDAVIAYTKENPVKALLLAAASGALLFTLFKAFARSPD